MYIAYHIKREYALFSDIHHITIKPQVIRLPRGTNIRWLNIRSAYHIKREYVLAKWSKVKPSFVFTYFIAIHVPDTFITISKTVFF